MCFLVALFSGVVSAVVAQQPTPPSAPLVTPKPLVAPAPLERPCREHPDVIAKCFSIRGRMSYYNGAPSVRIWPVGTTRLLGVSEGRFFREGFTNLPKDLEDRLAIDTTDLLGDFVVCPFTKDEPGVMRLVCVESGTNLKVVRQR